MSTFLKVAMGLLLALPLGAYIAGTLVASQADVAPERPPVVVEGGPSDLVSATSTPSATPSATSSPGAGSMPRPAHQPEDRSDRDRDDQPEVRVIRPTPHDLDNEREDERGDLDDAEDQTDGEADGVDEDEADEADEADESEDESVAVPDDGEREDDADREDGEESHDEGDDD